MPLDSFGHPFSRAEAASHSQDCLLELRSNAFGELDKESFALDGRLLLVLKTSALAIDTSAMDESHRRLCCLLCAA